MDQAKVTFYGWFLNNVTQQFCASEQDIALRINFHVTQVYKLYREELIWI